MTDTPNEPYSPLTPKLMMQLTSPHSWPASIFPVMIGTCLAMASGGMDSTEFMAFADLSPAPVSALMICVLLAISVLMQSCVNVVNDYYDYAKGTDTRENQDDPTDAVLVYNNVNPKSVLAFAIALVVCAFLLGIYVIYVAGWIPLAIALVGAAIIFLYSGGRTPISYLPIGEAVSGFTMGGLITLACYQALTCRFSILVLLLAVPVIIGIALIMATNNTCDIEKDIAAHRKTLPVLLGRERALTFYHGLIYTWMLSTCILVAVFFTAGWFILPFMLLAVHPIGRALLSNPLTQASRAAAFSQVASMNIAMGAFYGAAILASAIS